MNGLLSGRNQKIAGLAAGFAITICAMLASIVWGYVDTSWKNVIETLTNFSGATEHLVIRDLRIPRAFVGASVGASLGIAGVLLQAITRNPLADTGIFGINAGAAFFIVCAVTFFPLSSMNGFVWIAFLGAAVSGVAVYALGSLGRNGLNPLKVTLAGAAVSATASSFTSGLLTVNEKSLQEVLFWLTGSVEGRKMEMLLMVLPFMAVAWIGALLVAGQVNTLLLGEDAAKGLGQKTHLVKLCMGALIIVLAGSCVAIAGPIGFIGLIIPHLSRFLVGNDIRWVIPYSAFLGAILLLAADIAARFVAMPKELPIGVMTAFIGAPFFIYIARKGWANR
jgi:iron complex transport system permease protein